MRLPHFDGHSKMYKKHTKDKVPLIYNIFLSNINNCLHLYICSEKVWEVLNSEKKHSLKFHLNETIPSLCQLKY